MSPVVSILTTLRDNTADYQTQFCVGHAIEYILHLESMNEYLSDHEKDMRSQRNEARYHEAMLNTNQRYLLGLIADLRAKYEPRTP